MSITSSAVLVDLNISVWTANKLDRGETDKLLSTNAATRDAAKVHKNLMAGTSLRKDIEKLAATARTWNSSRTLPWSDRGTRLLPTSMFLDYKPEANTMRDQFEKMVDKFCDNYPVLVQQARTNLGNLFSEQDYPSVEEIRSKFAFRLTFSPVPEAGDFRLDVSANELAELSQQYEESFNERLADAMKEPWNRLHKVLTAMSEKLTEREGEGKKLYHETLVTNATELCDVLAHLNVTKDAKLEDARQQLENAMVGANIDMLRASASARQITKDKVDAILKQFEW